MRILVSALFIALTLVTVSKAAEPRPFPEFAEVREGKVYVPLSEQPAQLPKANVVFYPNLYNGEPKEAPVEAVFLEVRNDIEEGFFNKFRGYMTTSAVVYKLKEDRAGYRVGFILPAKINMVFDQKSSQYRTKRGDLAYRVEGVSSQEGGHYIIQRFEKGKCTASADHYLYAGYDTEPSPEGEFEKANCGEKM